MDADQPTRIWVRFTGALKTRWGKFRDEHLVLCEENYAQFVDTAREQYGDKKYEFLKGADQRHQQAAPEAVGEMSP
ncbi:MAG TPA: hypothetical protein VKK81_16570 [Candidatus Binatia bacterium]|nr:hypothetical protein [Candidatus Binatia bacterium]